MNQELRTKSILELTKTNKDSYRYTSTSRHMRGMLSRNPRAITLDKRMFLGSPPPVITLIIEAEWPQDAAR